MDAVVVGGGLQGLVALRALVDAGADALLVARGPLGGHQTLHSHGLLDSGNGLLTGSTHALLRDRVLPALDRLGVQVYGQDSSFLVLPDEAVDALRPAWDALGYAPQRVGAGSLPAASEPGDASVWQVAAHHVDKQLLVDAVASGLSDRIVDGDVVRGGPPLAVRLASGEMRDIDARAVVVAAGCGTARVLRGPFGIDAPVLGRVGFAKLHMICLRAPAGVLPAVGTVLSPEVLTVAHPDGDGVLWYVTPPDPSAPRTEDAPDDAVAPVDTELVASAVDAAARLFPSMRDGSVQVDAFAGWKQDVDGQPGQRLCEVVDSDRNVIVALPSILANCWANADDVLRLAVE